MRAIDRLLSKIEKAMQEEYTEIKQQGSLLSGIENLYRQVRFQNPELASYVRKRLLDIAENNGDLP